MTYQQLGDTVFGLTLQKDLTLQTLRFDFMAGYDVLQAPANFELLADK